MATLRKLTGTIANLTSETPEPNTVRIVIDNNLNGHPLIDSTNETIMVGGKGFKLENGAFEVMLPDTSATDLNVEPNTLQYVVRISYVNADRERVVDELGPFFLTADRDLSDPALDLDVPSIDPSWRSAFKSEIESIGAAAVAEAQAAADLAVDISGIETTDDAIDVALKLPGGKAAETLSNTIAAGIADREAAPSWSTFQAQYDPRLDVYNLRPDNMRKWRAARARAFGGLGSAHVTTHLDSMTYGAAATGVSNPKHANSWPGRLRRMFDAATAPAGTGIIPALNTLLTTPEHDPRWTFGGGVSAIPFGMFSEGAFAVAYDAEGNNYIDLTAVCDEFVVYAINGGNRPRVQVDGGAEKRIAGNPNTDPATTDYDALPGYWGAGTAAGQIVTVIPAGEVGEHTLRVRGAFTGISANIVGIEARIAGQGVRVSNLAKNGKSLPAFKQNSADGLSGRQIAFNMPKADLAILMLPMNDFQAHRSLTTFKADLTLCVEYQRDSGEYGPNGDIMFLTCPQPNYGAIPLDGIQVPPLTDYFHAIYEVADALDVPVLDLGKRWTDYSTSNSLGYYADSLHPGNLGSEDIAQAVFNALMTV